MGLSSNLTNENIIYFVIAINEYRDLVPFDNFTPSPSPSSHISP